MRPVEERFTRSELGEVRLRILRWGEPRRPALVLLHGAGANAHWWDHVAPELAEAHHVVALDFRGHGESDHPEDVEPGALALDLRALLAYLGAPGAVLVGHSLGAHVALGHASRHRETAALVLLDPTRGASPSRRRATRLALSLKRTHASREQAIARFRFLPEAARATEALRRSLAEHSVRAESDGRFGYKFDARWLGAAPSARPDLAAVRCPTLLVRGAESALLTRDGAAALAAEIGACRLVEIEGAGHHVHIDQPASVMREIRAFLASVEDARAALSSAP